MMSHKQPGCQVQSKMAVSKVASFKTNVFRIANISEADTLVSVRAVYLLYMLWFKFIFGLLLVKPV